MVIPNKQRATRSGAFLAKTRRARVSFSTNCVISRLCSWLHYTPSALLAIKLTFGSGFEMAVNKPK